MASITDVFAIEIAKNKNNLKARGTAGQLLDVADCFAGFDRSRCACALKPRDEDDKEKISAPHRCVYNALRQCVV